MRRWIEDIIIGVLAWLALYFAVTHGKETGAGAQIVEVIAEGLIACIIAYAVRVIRLRKQVSLLVEHYGELSGVQRRASFALFTPRLERALEALAPLTTSGVIVDKVEMEAFVDACFRGCEGAYQGTDSHSPTKFIELYPSYLLKQQRRRLSLALTSDTRFLLIEEKTLHDDFAGNPASVKNFIELHSKKDIRLLQVSPKVAATLAADLPSTDIGIFGWKYVVFFWPLTMAGGQSYKVVLNKLNETMSARLGKYLLDLNQEGRRVTLRNHAIELVSRGEGEVQDCKKRILHGYMYKS